MRKAVLAVVALCLVAVVGVLMWNGRKPAARRPRIDADPEIVINNHQLADAGIVLANQYTGEIHDTNSLHELREAIEKRGTGGLAALEAELAKMTEPAQANSLSAARLHFQIASLLMYEGRFEEAFAAIEKSQKIGKGAGIAPEEGAHLTALLGIISFRRGEIENCINCVGPSSCIFPLSREALHTEPAGSRQAIKYFTEYLQEMPGDVRVRWILNLAYMTLGEYPDKVPEAYRVPLDTFASQGDIGRFRNVAPLVGLTSRGPNQAGGSIFDDFTGDGLPDLFTTSLDADRGSSLFVNLGNGKFADRSDASGLADQIYALNLVRGDFDNDGNLDVLLLRGGWENPMRMSLLRNTGNGVFEDVTIDAGLGEPIAGEAAAWGDYDNDGLLDLFVCGEYVSPFSAGGTGQGDPRNRCRLYHNEGHGKFVNVAEKAGVAERQCSKGCAWGDFDGDGRLDLFVSNMNTRCRLYRNEGNGRFRDVASELGITGPERGFACWFWDYDNDGRLDLYVNDYSSSFAEFVAQALKAPLQHSSRPRLYRNLGSGRFEEVSQRVGLDRMMMPMGCNFADIDNDGFLDIYYGTGRMALEVLVPNLMFRNNAGRRFEDVTTSSGTGHLQKGHGVSFADWDCDGDLDLFVESGGAVPGDRAYNVLFENPGHGRHWLKVRLIGTKTNRSAIGAKIQAVIKGADGTEHSVYRTVGNNGSFGGNSLVETIGLGDATSIAELIITWPTSQTTQTFRDLPADQALEITEESDALAPLPQPWQRPESKPAKD